MDKTNNVIDLKLHLDRKRAAHGLSPSSAESLVVDITERRQEMLSQERRKVRRTILAEFIGTYIVVPGRGLARVVLHDISEDGLAFDLDSSNGTLATGEEVAMRVYLNKETYFPFIVRVSNVRTLFDHGVSRHGCNFVKGTINDEALHHFVKFIETVSASLRTDSGDIMVSGIGR